MWRHGREVATSRCGQARGSGLASRAVGGHSNEGGGGLSAGHTMGQSNGPGQGTH